MNLDVRVKGMNILIQKNLPKDVPNCMTFPKIIVLKDLSKKFPLNL